MARVKLGDVAREYKATCGDQKEGLRVVGLEHLIPQQIILTLWDEGKENTFTKMFKKGQVLFGRRRAYLKKAAVAPFDGICSGDITVIEAIPGKIIPELLPFIIQNDTLFDFAVERSAGSLSPRVKWEHLKNFEFELPELDKQQELSDILWASERAKTAYRELISSTDELVKSQFIEMFGNPNDARTEFVVTDALEIRDDLRKPLNDGVRSTMYEGTLYPYYGANGKVDEINQYLMDCDAICLAEDCGSYGAGEPSSYIVSGKVWVNNHAHILIPKANCNIRFANEYFRLLDITQYISGTTRAKLTQGQLKILPMMIPDIEKQEAFCALIEQFDKSKFAAKQALENLERTQKSLMNRYLG